MRDGLAADARRRYILFFNIILLFFCGAFFFFFFVFGRGERYETSALRAGRQNTNMAILLFIYCFGSAQSLIG